MNFFLKLVSAIFLIFSIACSKNEHVQPVNELSNEVIDEFYKSSIVDKRLIFRILTPVERLSVWEREVVNFSLDEDLDAAQLKLVEELLSKLNVSLFGDLVDDIEYREYFVNSFLKDWREKAKRHFREEEIITLLLKPKNFLKGGDVKVLGSGLRYSEIPGDNDCDCNRDNSYDCKNTRGSLECRKEICEESWFGCGDLWLQSCNGKCYSDGVPVEF